jgi:alpha-beta hydrolase superfamily lysophospholipase
VLLLYGAQDQIVPGRMTRAALSSLPPGAQLRIGVYEEGYHLLLSDRNRETVVRDILAFLAAPNGPLPSGAEEYAPRWLAR